MLFFVSNKLYTLRQKYRLLEIQFTAPYHSSLPLSISILLTAFCIYQKYASALLFPLASLTLKKTFRNCFQAETIVAHKTLLQAFFCGILTVFNAKIGVFRGKMVHA